MTDSETDNITEQEYILLANDFKLRFDELKRKLFLKNIKIKSLQKELITDNPSLDWVEYLPTIIKVNIY